LWEHVTGVDEGEAREGEEEEK